MVVQCRQWVNFYILVVFINNVKKIGIDLGGTKIEGILLDEENKVLAKKRIPTPKNNYEKILSSIVDLINQLTSSKCKIGICTPGILSKETGLIQNSNTQCLIGKPFKNDLESRLNQKISIENDANCFAIAEAVMGNAIGYNVVFGVIMGTGVGGGIVINKKIHRGRLNIAGEWGHHTLYPNGQKCYCGNKGCVEMYLSGPQLEKRWLQITGKWLPLEKISEFVDSKEGKLWKSEFLFNFGLALANVIDILDPDAIVLGGGVSNLPFLYTEGKQSVYQKVFSNFVDTPILHNKLGDSAGVYGAALLDEFFKLERKS